MRILSLCTESDRIMGGRGENVLHVNERLTKLGHQVHQVSYDAVWHREWSFETSSPGKTVFYPFSDGGAKNYLVNSHATFQHCLGLGGFDIIMAHDWDMVQPGLELSQHWGIPLVTVFHLLQHEMAILEGKTPNDEAMLPIAMEWNGFLKSSRVICVSHYMANYAREYMGIDRALDVVHNGVDNSWGHAERYYHGSKPVLLFVGRIAFQKGWDEFARVAELTDRYEIWVAGKHAALDEHVAEATEDMAYIRSLERLPHFRYLGHVERYERDQLYANCDAVVMPSRSEPFGIVALEALAAGKPLITTRVDGMQEFLSDGNSWPCECTAESILEVADDLMEKTFSKLLKVEAGLKTARAFTWDMTAARVEQILVEEYVKARSAQNHHAL